MSTAEERAARLAKLEQWVSERDERIACLEDELAEAQDRGASLELEERAHERTSAECARLEAECERLRADFAYAADPLNWDGVWTADPDAPLSHGNLVELYHGTGQVLWSLRPRGGENRG